MKKRLIGLLICSALASFADLTPDQKTADLKQLASLYARNYGPYEWKRDTQNFDLRQLQPWIDRAAQTKDDLEFMDLLVEFVADLNDAHDLITFPSDFSATLGFTTDMYDGKVLIDSINRSTLPASQYPVAIGDEIISVDGRSTDEWIRYLSKYSVAANPRSTQRAAAAFIPRRFQSYIPRAAEIGDAAEVVIRRNSGSIDTFTIPWVKTGTPLTAIGPMMQFNSQVHRLTRRQAPRDLDSDESPAYLEPLRRLQNAAIPAENKAVLGVGSMTPVYAPPSNIRLRMGFGLNDNFLSGTFTSGVFRIGLIRIPSFTPSSTSLALQQFETEIAYMQANTDGLIIDIMHNPGGSVAYTEQLLSRIMPNQFRSMGFEVRPSASWIASFSAALTSAKQAKASDTVIASLQQRLDDIRKAYAAGSARTPAVSITQSTLDLNPATDKSGNVIAYNKPIMLLVDEFTASGGDMFAAVFQDNQRGLVYGNRTMGAGGNVVDFDATNYTEGYASVTTSLMSRRAPVAEPGYPTAPYVENIGVWPDVNADVMTRDNLVSGGREFTSGMIAAMIDYLTSKL